MAIDPAILAHSDVGAVPPCDRVLFAPIVWGMEAYNIDATMFHGTLTYYVTRGKIKNADIVSADILINSIASVPGNFGVDTNLTPKITLVRTRHAANKTMSHYDTRGGFSSFLKSSNGNSFLGESRKKHSPIAILSECFNIVLKSI